MARRTTVAIEVPIELERPDCRGSVVLVVDTAGDAWRVKCIGTWQAIERYDADEDDWLDALQAMTEDELADLESYLLATLTADESMEITMAVEEAVGTNEWRRDQMDATRDWRDV